MPSSADKLRECPFCGNDDIKRFTISTTEDSDVYMMCDDCHCSISGDESTSVESDQDDYGVSEVERQQMIGQWNTRAAPSDKRVEALLDAAKKKAERLEYELMAVMQLGVDKWLEGPDLELNNATRAGRAREIALQAIEKPTALLRECVEALEEMVVVYKQPGVEVKATAALTRARAFLEGK